MGYWYFVIVGKADNPIYEVELTPQRKDDQSQLRQFILHASLDMIDEIQWTTNALHLKTIDKFNDFHISGYVTPGYMKLLLLHDEKNDDGVRNFFSEVHETFIKVIMNPFYEQNGLIESKNFDTKVKAVAKKYLQ